MARPRVSVITATYNRSRVLRHTIASVIAQDFADWELLVVGDAGTDDTADVVASFRDPRIRFFSLPQNVGEQSGPNNAGVAATMACRTWIRLLPSS
jgi:glycosyltransferase involved in cell wall biosynthesis